jgi:hypothetical protein
MALGSTNQTRTQHKVQDGNHSWRRSISFEAKHELASNPEAISEKNFGLLPTC